MKPRRSCTKNTTQDQPGLDQRLAEAELDEWGSLIQREHKKNSRRKRKEKNANSNQLEDKEQACLRRVNRAIFKANNGCLRAAKQIMLVSTKAAPGDETTTMIQAKLPKDDLPEEEWVRMREEIEDGKKIAWKIKPLSRRRVLARLEMIKMVRNQVGRPRGTTICSRRIELIRELGSDMDDGLGKKS